MNPQPAIVLDEASHTYYVDGVAVPWSVTQVLEASGLVDFSGSAVEAMWRGGRVHAAIHYDIEGDLDEASVLPGDFPYVLAARKAREHLGLTVQRAEYRVYHQLLRVAGTLDAEGETPKWPHALIDWKAGGIQKGYGVQLAAYAYLREAQGGTPAVLQHRVTIQLLPDGTFRLKEWPQIQIAEDWAAFSGALTMLNYRRLRGYPPVFQGRDAARLPAEARSSGQWGTA